MHVPVDVPNFTNKELQLSQLVLGAGGDLTASVDAVIGLDRLRGLVPFQPSTERVFSVGQMLRVHTKASWRSKDARLVGEVQIVGIPPLPGGLEGPFSVTTDKKGQRHAMLDFTLTLDGLAPGTYVLGVVARLNESESVTRVVPFSIR